MSNFSKILLAMLFFFTTCNIFTAVDYWIDIRLPGEYPSGGKRNIFLKPKVPAQVTALCLVEKWINRKIEPLVATEYYAFRVKHNFYIFIPKHADVFIKPNIEKFKETFSTYVEEKDLKKLFQLLKYILEIDQTKENIVNFRFFNHKDFCKRLALAYPEHSGLPCCEQRVGLIEFLAASDLPPIIRRKPSQKIIFTLKPIS